MKTTRDCHYMGEGEGLRDKRSETKSAGAVSTCSNSFGVSLEEARLRERERLRERGWEQNKSNQGIFRRRDVWPKSISASSLPHSLCPALSTQKTHHQCPGRAAQLAQMDTLCMGPAPSSSSASLWC